MKKMKVLFPLILLGSFFSNLAVASPETCGFDGLEGDLIEFTDNDVAPERSTLKSQLPVYRYFSNDQAGDHKLLKSVYRGRKAIFDFSRSFKRVVHMSAENRTEVTHVYTGYADNCTRVFAQVKESDFPLYYNHNSVMDPDEINFFFEENTLGILFHESEKFGVNDSSYITGEAYVLPNTSSPIYFYDKFYEGSRVIAPFTKITVLGKEYVPFSFNGSIVSDFRLRVSIDGVEGFINGHRAGITKKNPILQVRPKYRDAVLSGRIQFGMNLSELLTSLGLPDSSESFNVYRNSKGFHIDYKGEYSDSDEKVFGRVLTLNYDDIPFPITIDMYGDFAASDQVFYKPKYHNKLQFMKY